MPRFLLTLFCCALLPAAWAGTAAVAVPMQVERAGPHSYFVHAGRRVEANRVNACNQYLRLEQETGTEP